MTTHEPAKSSASTMSTEQILAHLSGDRSVPPREALALADAHRQELLDELLQAINVGVDDTRGASQEEASFFAYALYLVAKWRERRAYPYVI